MAAGGTAPINTSRVMPPALPAAKDNTIPPKISNRCLTAAAAPLIANTNVPPRSSTIDKVCVMGLLAQTGTLGVCDVGQTDRQQGMRQVDSQVRAATTRASTPVPKVGWITGANFGL